MNLIYIWFYDYKCFKERGINLMPDKYSIDVIDFGTNFLELKIDKKIWIPSPLQTKVRDVYAIISKNGKGKSTLLDVMTNENEYCYELFDFKYVDGDYVVIYEDEGYYYYNIKVTQIPYHYFCVTINNKGSCRFLNNYTSQYITKDVIMIQPNQDRVKYVDLLHFILERKDELGVHGDCRLVFLINDKEDSQSYIVKDIKKLLFKRFCKISCSNMSKEMSEDYYKVLSANENEFDSLYTLFLKKYKNNIYLYKGLIDNFINIINIINILGTDIFEILDEGIGIKIAMIQSFTQKNYDIFELPT